MDLARPRNRLALAGAVAALAAGALIAFVLVRSHRGEPAAAPPASQSGLIIESSGAGLGHIDQSKPLRCFVDGRLVGELSLADCARRNGVATDALGVGVDSSGALAAAPPGAAAVTPLPPSAVQPAPAARPQAAQTAGGGAGALAGCWTYAGASWRRLPSETTLNGCVQALFAGRCERAGGATYGRWGEQTLRLVPGRIEISADNRSFRTLAEQGPGCTAQAAG